MLDPTGTPRMVPADQVPALQQAGGKTAVKMLDPQGTPRWVPQDQQNDLIQAGGKLADQPQQPNPYDKNTFMGNLRASGEELKGVIKGGARTAAGLIDATNSFFSPGVSQDPAIRRVTDAVRARTVPNNEYQKRGDIFETLGEFASPAIGDAIAERLGLAAESPAAGEAVQKASEQLGTMAKRAKIFEEHPDIHAMVQRGINAIKSTAPGRVIADTVAGATEGAARGAAEQGAQGYVKSGGDLDETRENAEAGLLWGAGGGALFGGGARALREGSQAIDNARPITLNLSGADFPALAGGREFNMGPLEGQPDPVSLAVDSASGNIGKTAVANSLWRSLRERPVGMRRETQFDRLLPAPEGSAQGFRVGTTPPREVGQPPRTTTETVVNGKRTVPNPDYEAPAGELAPPVPGQSEAETAGQIGEGLTAATPPRSYTGPERADTRNPTKKRIDAARGLVPDRMLTPPETAEQPVYQQRPVTTQPGETITTHPERATEVQPDPQRMGGGGPLILTSDGQASSVEKARLELIRRQRVLDDPDMAQEMGTRQRQAMQSQVDDLSEQLRRYDDFAAKQAHFPVPNIPEAISHTTSLGEAGDLLKAHHGAFWQAADDASGGEFSNLRDEEKRLEKQIYGENPTGKLDDLRQQLAENQQKQMDFFDKYRTTVSPQEWDTARTGYQDGIVLKNLHNLVESNFNGITREDVSAAAAEGKPLPKGRVFQPTDNFNKQLEKFYSGGFRNTSTNRDVLERTIGSQHMLDLKRMGQLFENSERRAATKGLMDNISQSVRHHFYGISGLGGAAAYGAAHAAGTTAGLGIEAVLPTAAGALGLPMIKGGVTGTYRYIADRIATDPDFMKRFTYAVTNKIPPRTAGPVLASRLLSTPAATIQNQQNQQGRK